MKHVKILAVLLTIGTVFFLFAIQNGRTQNQTPESIIRKNIERIKERLGDNLAKTADEVIDRHVRALGGREALLSVKTLMYRGRNVRFGKGDRPLYRYYRQPHFIRQMGSPGSTSYLLSDGEKVWQVTPEGRREMNQWWTKSTLHLRIDGDFIDYKERDIRYEYLGLEAFETEPFAYYHLRRTYPDKHVEDLYFDVESGLLHGIWQTSTPRKDNPRFFYDYRDVDGILFPFAHMRVFDRANPPHLFLIEEVKINQDFGEGFFTDYKHKPVLGSNK
jgi:hypothetical protein